MKSRSLSVLSFDLTFISKGGNGHIWAHNYKALQVRHLLRWLATSDPTQAKAIWFILEFFFFASSSTRLIMVASLVLNLVLRGVSLKKSRRIVSVPKGRARTPPARGDQGMTPIPLCLQ